MLAEDLPSSLLSKKTLPSIGPSQQRSSLRVVSKPAESPKRTSLNVYLVADRVTDTRSCIKTNGLFHIETLKIPGFDRAQLYAVKRNS